MIWRKRKSADYYGRRGECILITLECDHVIRRKASQGIPHRARCRDCEHNREPAAGKKVARLPKGT